MPGVWRSAPSSASSPRKAAASSGAAGSWALARSSPTASGRPYATASPLWHRRELPEGIHRRSFEVLDEVISNDSLGSKAAFR